MDGVAAAAAVWFGLRLRFALATRRRTAAQLFPAIAMQDNLAAGARRPLLVVDGVAAVDAHGFVGAALEHTSGNNSSLTMEKMV